jgi:YVTN family beta-propeller protein
MGRRQGVLLAVIVTSAIGLGPRTASAAIAWVANQEDGTISRIDLTTHEAVTLNVGTFPYGVAASRDGLRAYVGNVEDGTVSVIDAVTPAVIATVPVGTYPRGIAVTPDGAKVYVAVNQAEVVVIDTVALTAGPPITVIPPESFGNLGGMAMNTAGSRVYVAKHEYNIGSVAVLDTTSDAVVADILATTNGYGMHAVAVSADDTRVWATAQGTGEVYELDATTSLLVRPIPLACTPGCDDGAALVPHPDGSRVYVALPSAQRLAILDADAGAETGSIPVEGVPMSVDVTPDGARLYVLSPGAGDRIDIVDTASEAVVGSLLAVGQGPIAFGRFIAGEADDLPVPPPPVLGAAARACQDAIAGSWKRFPAKAHKTFASCLDRLLDDVASGAGTAAAATSCVKNLDPGNPASSLSRMRATARAKLLSGCAGVTPAALALPCSDEATTLAEVADCVLDAQTRRLTETLASEYGAPCSLAAAAGLATMHPGLCAAAP